MAVCEIWDVRGRLDHPIDYAENPEKTANPKYTEADLQAMVDVMEYATNKDKTEQRYFVTGVNCDPTTARDEMMIAKAQWNDESEIVCYHGFQSFKHGEVTPEQAHEVGVKLAQKMWGDRFQVIVATHLNTDCLHNHFVVNSVSFTDGKHYHDNKANLRLLRQRSDELCREYALSVIEHPSGKKKPYALYQAEKNGMPTRDNVTRQAVDEAISKSFTLKDFDRIMAEMGYRVSFDPNRKYWTVIGKGWKRPKRLLSELLADENNSLWSQVLYGISVGDGEIVTVALSQVGNTGGQPYWSWYGFNSRVEWCACFVSWCANECGYIENGIIPKFAGCIQGSEWFKERGQWQDGSFTPEAGHIIFFDWEGDGLTDHVGIVERVENGTVYTVEGNSGDACRQNSYSIGSSVIYGYGIPAY